MKKLLLFAVFAAAIFVIAAPVQAQTRRISPVVEIVRQCSPSIVNISTEQKVFLAQNPFWGQYGGQFDQMMAQFYAQTQTPTASTTVDLGSGVVVTEDGIIVTNAHVVQMASKIIVTLMDKSTYEAKLLGTSAEHDLALIKIEAPKKLRPMKMAEDWIVGEDVISIGNPLGLDHSVSKGILSGTHRSFSTQGLKNPFKDLLQTDASINLGSSGGALINMDGKLAGINLAMVQTAQNIGFAIPSYKIKDMLAAYYAMLKEQKKK